MAVAKSVIEFALTADASGLVGGIAKAKGEFANIEAAATKAGAATGQSLDKLQSSLSSAGNKMLGVGAALTAATLPLTLALKSGLDALVEADRRAAQTAATIKSTGGAAGVSADQVTGLTKSLRDMSGVSGANIRDGENMVLTFTNVKNSVGQGRDVFDRTTKAALDMSVALGTDVKTAAQTLGRALQDPEQGMGRLARAGVVLSEQQKQQIRDFTAVGDTASAQGVILDQVAKQFGGSAQAFGDSAAGQVGKLENKFTELKMTLAQELLPAFEQIVGVVTDAVDWFNGLDDGTKRWIATAAVALVAGGPILTGLGALTKMLNGIVGLYGKLTVSATEAAVAEQAAATAGAGAGVGLGAGAGAGIGSGAAAGGAGALWNAQFAAQQAASTASGSGGLGTIGMIGMSSGALGLGGGALAGAAAFDRPLPKFFGNLEDPSTANDAANLEKAISQTQSLTDKQNLLKEAVDRSTVADRSYFDSLARSSGMEIQWGHTGGLWDNKRTVIEGFALSADTAAKSTVNLATSGAGVLPFMNNFAAGLGLVAQQAATTGLNVGQLNMNLEGFDGWLSSEQAAMNYDHAIQGVDATLQNKTATESQARDSMFQLEGATRQHIQGLVDQGASEVQIQAAIDGSKGKLDEIKAKYPELGGQVDTYKGKLQQLIDTAKTQPRTKPEVDTAEATRKLDAYKALLKTVQGNLLTQHVQAPPLPPPGARGGVIADGVAHFAAGGMFDRATAIVGEGRGREWVIPEDPAYRKRALGLWHQAGAALMAAGGTVGGDGAAAPIPVAAPIVAAGPDESVPVLVQIRDILAAMSAAGPPTAAAQLAPAPGPDLGGAAPSGGGAPAPTGAGDAAAATDTLTAATATYTAAAALATTTVQTFDAQVMQAATATLPTATAATQMGDQATQSATAAFAGQIPVQAAWQAQLTASKGGVDMLTAAVNVLIGRMQALDATQVALHVDHSQVETAAGSIGSLAGSIQGALGSLGLSTNALTQWLGVVLSLPSGVLAGAVGAESGGVVGSVGAGMKGHTPTLVMEGSRAHDEYVIPTDPKYRRNALSLLGGLHSDLGIPQMASGGVVGKVGQAIANTTAGAMQTGWTGTATSAPGSLGSATAGSLMAAAAFNAGGSGSQKMVDYAMAQSGDAYVWGAEGPDAWDCSGLVLGSAAAAGLPGLPHYSGSLYDMSAKIPVGQAIGTPGAILWHPGHIAISRGDGQTIEARGVAYGVGSWPAEGRFTGGGLLPFTNEGSVSDAIPAKWQGVGKYISDSFRAAGIGVGPSVAGEDGEAGGGQFSGKISTFGGPGDFQPTAYDGSTNDMYNAGVPYAAMRLAPQGEIPLAPRSWIQINKGAASTRAQLLDWGPASWTGRIVDVAPYVASAIGANTDDLVGVTGLAKGGKIPAAMYDQGGLLPQGLSLAYNGTGAPEPVIPAKRLGGDGVTVNVTVNVEGSVTAESDLADRIAKAIRASVRRGGIGVG